MQRADAIYLWAISSDGALVFYLVIVAHTRRRYMIKLIMWTQLDFPPFTRPLYPSNPCPSDDILRLVLNDILFSKILFFYFYGVSFSRKRQRTHLVQHSRPYGGERESYYDSDTVDYPIIFYAGQKTPV